MEAKEREIEKGEWLFAVGFKMKRCLQVFITENKQLQDLLLIFINYFESYLLFHLNNLFIFSRGMLSLVFIY